MNRPIELAISTCPNDTFAFHAIMDTAIDLRGLEFNIQLMDIEELNRGIFAGRFDIAKASFHAAVLLADNWHVLPVGAALGSGIGPLLLSGRSDHRPSDMKQLTLCPGAHTTAALLFKLFHGCTRIQHVVFSEIMPALQNQQADFGVCIHEGRFTYQDAGLFLVEDLGTRWESETGCLLPLGGILARRDLSPQTLEDVCYVVQNSIRYGIENKTATLPTMRRYAGEFADDILFKHVDLYVNQWTLDLGNTGREALQKLSELAFAAGIRGEHPISVFEN